MLLRNKKRRKILALAWPAVLANLMYTVVSLVDLIMVGSLGAEAVAAVGLGGLLIWISYGVMASVATGTTALVARFIGAREKRDSEKVLTQSFVLVAGFSIFITVAALMYSEKILAFIGTERAVAELGGVYLRTVFIATVFIFLTLVAEGALRGAGDTKTPLKIDLIINGVNLGLDYLLIYGNFGFPKLGVLGAGIASASAFTMGAVLYFGVLLSNRYVLSFRFSDLSIDFGMMRRILRIGVPSSIEKLIMSGSIAVYASIIVGFGTIPLAAHQIGLRIEALSFMPGIGFAVAATALVGQNLGAKERKKAYAMGWETSKLCVGFMTLVGVILFIFPREFILFFTRDESVIELGILYLRLVAISQPFLALTFVLTGALDGAGDTRRVMYITIFGLWFFRLPLAYFLGITMGYGVLGAWIAMIIDIFVRSLALVYRFKSKKWMEIKV
ncbi:MAG: MATE family efflux transporter [Candidatus Hydrothermarchaeota archaeon]|nr:MATE family efflux transporter [Candidatus Hydrothermarchaeota archaeon]